MEKDIGKINKNETSDIIIRIDDFGGNTGLTIREFVTSERYTGFTKSGVRILASDFPKFKEMINSIKDEDMTEEASPEEKELESGQETLNTAMEKTEEASEAPKEEQDSEEAPKEDDSKEKPKEDLPDY